MITLQGRATHVHVKVHTKWTPHANGTFTSGNQVHTGQLFVEDSINEVIDKIHPYTTNPIKDKWGRTRNWADSLKIFPESHGNGYQPTFEIQKLGGVIQQGLIGYVTVGSSFSFCADAKASADKPSRHRCRPLQELRPKPHPAGQRCPSQGLNFFAEVYRMAANIMTI